jgi:2-polyprenyl-6-methoxyphenol hydroxylase-like FAD-dependent oxidoreductase
MAGLLAAQVLTQHFERVTLVERDHFPQTPEQRAGVPQARHLHVLLARGHQVLEKFFPGLDAELQAAGVPRVELGYDTTAFTRGGWMPRFHSGIFTSSVSRVLLEYTVRCRLLGNERIEVMEGWQANGLTTTPDRSRITGVQLQARGGSREERTLEADFVVDAGGRTSHSPDWLEALGYGKTEETIVNSFLGYSTRWYRKSAGFREFWRDILIASVPPENPRGAALWEVEGDRWVVTLAGVNRDYPPTEEAGFMDFARSLAVPTLYDAIRDAEPISDIYGYQRTENRRRHFERFTRWPEGFVVMGDAACGFNPVYGQGMSVAAMESETLDTCLRDGARHNLTARFQKQLSKVIDLPWLMATGEDLRYPETEGERPGALTRLTQKYIDQVQVRMSEDVEIARTFMEVSNLVKPPAALFQPAYVWKVLAKWNSSPQPAVQPA